MPIVNLMINLPVDFFVCGVWKYWFYYPLVTSHFCPSKPVTFWQLFVGSLPLVWVAFVSVSILLSFEQPSFFVHILDELSMFAILTRTLHLILFTRL